MRWQQLFYFIGGGAVIGISNGLLSGRIPIGVALFTLCSIMIDSAASIIRGRKPYVFLSTGSAALLGIALSHYI